MLKPMLFALFLVLLGVFATQVASTGIDVMLITDPSEEIDDEMAIHLLAAYGYTLYTITRLVLVFVNGEITAQERLDKWKAKFGISLTNAQVTLECFTIDEASKVLGNVYDYVVQIAPLYRDCDKLNGLMTRKYVFAGDYPTPEGATPSFNMNGSDEILTRMKEQGILTTISSSLMAKMKPCDRVMEILGKNLVDAVKFTAFKLAIGRMNPRIPIAKKFAEGLVHYVEGKTRGANFNLVKNLFRIFTGKELEYVSVEVIGSDSNYYKLAVKYFHDIHGDAYLHEMTYGEEAIMSLARINYGLEQIVPGIWEGRERVICGPFADENFGGDVSLQTSFATYKEKKLPMLTEEQRMSIYNPAYDLFAVVFALEKEKVGSPQEFYDYFKNLNIPKDSADEPMEID